MSRIWRGITTDGWPPAWPFSLNNKRDSEGHGAKKSIWRKKKKKGKRRRHNLFGPLVLMQLIHQRGKAGRVFGGGNGSAMKAEAGRCPEEEEEEGYASNSFARCVAPHKCFCLSRKRSETGRNNAAKTAE